MSEPIIKIDSLGKKYRLNHQGEGLRYTALRDVITDGVKRLFSRKPAGLQTPNPRTEDFWALKDVCLNINKGEVVGVIGRNGAGKSTLLKLLSRITEPTEGRIAIRGRIASLLEVGTGFHPELTGRENIYLNGAILGMKRLEIKQKFDEIVAFADVEKFLDTPVKRYSSGMYVRLAFAVAAHLEPDILVVDEVLAVGDADFQKKCLGRMEAISRENGRTILFVSHNMSAIRTLCSKAVVLDRGRILSHGPVAETVDAYMQTSGAHISSRWNRPSRPLDADSIFFQAIDAILSGSQPTLLLTLHAHIICLRRTSPKLLVAVDICDAAGTPLMQALPSPEPFVELREGDYNLHLTIDLPPLIPGRYLMDLWIGSHFTSTEDYVKNTVAIDIDDSPQIGRSFPHHSNHGYLVPHSLCRYERLSSSVETSELASPR